MRKIKSAFILLTIICTCALKAQITVFSEDFSGFAIITAPKGVKIGFDSTYVPISTVNKLQDKLFYLLTVIQKSDYQAINEQPEFKTLRERYITLLAEVSNSTSISKTVRQKFLISKTESESLKIAFVRAYNSDVLMRNIVKKELLPSGNWEMYYAGTTDTTFLKLVVGQTVAAIDTIINQYLVGTKSQYPEDGPSDSNGPKNLYATDYVQQFVSAINSIDKNSSTVLNLPIATALSLLKMNNRDEAVRFEPIATGENKVVLANLKNIVWGNYTYASLIVPGDSPNSSGDAINLSESAKKHVQYAVEAYNGGLAPVIILSGANVYPYYPPTQYFEAIEMKKYMMRTYSIPENVILVDPYARHTTTNLRNAARLIIRLGIPRYKKSLIVTTKSQNDIIEAPSFTTRCKLELGFMPGTLGERIADVRLEFTPNNINCLTIDPKDPLDP
jgi:hypothetical protein